MMDESLQIPLPQLRRAFDMLLEHMEGSVGDIVSLDKEYFWSIPVDDLYDVLKEPSDLTIGQLSESWQHVTEMTEGDPRVLGFGLVWLADVLRAIGYQHVE
jgi:hypothetical protein